VTGVITGGWEFVIGAYVLTAVVLGVYVFSVISRHSKEFASLERQANRSTEVE
jgi:uncharacterized membrane protein (DUF485 family)